MEGGEIITVYEALSLLVGSGLLVATIFQVVVTMLSKDKK
ncbi:putative holin-like toxin [Ammoniphilus sp. 3BR4]